MILGRVIGIQIYSNVITVSGYVIYAIFLIVFFFSSVGVLRLNEEVYLLCVYFHGDIGLHFCQHSTVKVPFKP
jgi:hypothetical protein